MSMFRNLMMRKTVPGFVGGWKAYGRSNTEDPSTRGILPDYSGNGRDIKLYNFAFAGMSGYGGYRSDYSFSINQITTKVVTANTKDAVRVSYVSTVGFDSQALALLWQSASVNTGVSHKITAGPYGAAVSLYKAETAIINILTLAPGETGSFTIREEDITSGYRVHIGPSVAQPADVQNYFDFLPAYPGGLVSDGVDDYGQCIKGFALPDDYTVVAVRKMLTSSYAAPFVAKSGSAGNGAFIMEYAKETLCYSYGQASGITNNVPILFSYQMKSRYNGITINKGSSIDSDSDILMLFRLREGVSSYNSYVLYDLRIYDHSLTGGELRRVRKEMLQEYVRETGNPIDNI